LAFIMAVTDLAISSLLAWTFEKTPKSILRGGCPVVLGEAAGAGRSASGRLHGLSQKNTSGFSRAPSASVIGQMARWSSASGSCAAGLAIGGRQLRVDGIHDGAEIHKSRLKYGGQAVRSRYLITQV